MAAAASGRFSELIMTNPKPSLSFRLMTTSLGCELAGALSEAAVALTALGVWAAPVLLPYVKSLRGELCCVDAEQGLRPFSGSPAGGDGRGRKNGRQRRQASQNGSGMKWNGEKSV